VSANPRDGSPQAAAKASNTLEHLTHWRRFSRLAALVSATMQCLPAQTTARTPARSNDPCANPLFELYAEIPQVALTPPRASPLIAMQRSLHG